MIIGKLLAASYGAHPALRATLIERLFFRSTMARTRPCVRLSSSGSSSEASMKKPPPPPPPPPPPLLLRAIPMERLPLPLHLPLPVPLPLLQPHQ